MARKRKNNEEPKNLTPKSEGLYRRKKSIQDLTVDDLMQVIEFVKFGGSLENALKIPNCTSYAFYKAMEKFDPEFQIKKLYDEAFEENFDRIFLNPELYILALVDIFLKKYGEKKLSQAMKFASKCIDKKQWIATCKYPKKYSEKYLENIQNIEITRTILLDDVEVVENVGNS